MGFVRLLTCCNISLQWSPTEADVFASASVDKTIAIWDIRQGKSAFKSFKAHDADVNVISWNRLAALLSSTLFTLLIISAPICLNLYGTCFWHQASKLHVGIRQR